MKDNKLPLGRETGYPHKYAPETLFPLSRADNRRAIGIGADLPFGGVDIWNAWELTWLSDSGCPVAATATIIVPADSPNIVESKSLKLYLNSFAMSTFSCVASVVETVQKDVSACAGRPVQVRVLPISGSEARSVSRLAGTCLDSLDVACEDWEVNSDSLTTVRDCVVTEDLNTHLLRSLCPVTSQPDTGSLQISYRGPQIERAGLLRYIVSFRQHNDFHESCVERMFVDIMEKCAPHELTLNARYQRRGGIDINPFRSNTAENPRNPRLWRQ